MRVFLTGGTGFIGKPLTRQLLKRGWQVTVLVRNPDSSQARALIEMGASLVKGDITDKASTQAGMNGADMVIHNAAWYEYGVTAEAAKRMEAINVQGTEHVLSAAKELGIQRIVYVSSIIAFGDSGTEEQDETFTPSFPKRMTAYTRSKAQAHQVAMEYQKHGLPLVTVCPGQVIGANDHSVWGYFARLYVNSMLPPMSWAKHSLQCHAWVEDIAEGIALAAEKGKTGEAFFLTGATLTIKDALDIWTTTPGGSKWIIYLPNSLAYFMFATLEPLERMIGIPAFISRETVDVASLNYNFSNQKARRELGWNPRPAREVWLEILAAERELRHKRKKRDIASRLRPMED